MKKQLMVAVVAATMASASMADISITGDAYFSYANNETAVADTENGNRDNQRVRLKVVGSTGVTKVTAVIRNNGVTRADKQNNVDISGNGRNDSNIGWNNLHMDSLYVTTKVGPVSIKAGDYWGTIGLGARSKGAGKKNALALSTSVGGVKLGMFTHNGSVDSDNGSTNVSASGKVAGATIKVVHNPDNFTDISVKGTFAGISVAAEQWADKVDGSNNDTTLIHVGGKVSGLNWDVAQIENDVAANLGSRNVMASGKLAPLGSMLIGKAARGGTATAVADVSNFTKILGLAVSTKLAGNTIKAIFSKNTLGTTDKVTGAELILTRPLGGAKLTVNLGKVSDADDTVTVLANGASANGTNKGVRLDVKF